MSACGNNAASGKASLAKLAGTTGRLFDYFAEIGLDDRITGSGLTASYFINRQTELSLGTSRLASKVSLPTIPGYGELTLYYDMFAHLNVVDAEVARCCCVQEATSRTFSFSPPCFGPCVGSSSRNRLRGGDRIASRMFSGLRRPAACGRARRCLIPLDRGSLPGQSG